MSQSDLALTLTELSGEPWDQSKVSRAGRAPDNLPVGELRQIARALGVSPLELLETPEPTGPAGVDVGEPLATVHAQALSVRQFVQERSWTTGAKGFDGPRITDVLTLCERAERKPTIAFFGKFDVGKSTLVNAVLGAGVMPTSYQPATKIVIYVRHTEDRPAWLLEDVLILGSGFNPQRWSEEGHSLKHKVAAGGMDVLTAHGSHQGARALDDGAAFALVFVDAPVLKAATIIDLPGTENDTTDTTKAESQQVTFDLAVFADTSQGFLGEGTLLRLGDVVRRLPAITTTEPGHCLDNLIIVATHAHPGISDQQLHQEILPGGTARAWRHLGETALQAHAEAADQQINQENLRARVFPFYRDVASRRQPLLDEIARVLAETFPTTIRHEFHTALTTFQSEAINELGQALGQYHDLLRDRQRAQEQLDKALAAEPAQRKARKLSRTTVEAEIRASRAEMRSSTSDYCTQALSPDAIEKVIRAKFPDKKDAQQNAAAYICEQLQNHVERDAKKRAKKIATQVNDYLGHY
ncbi:MAG: dynamin family protein, partial [Mycobacteriaceae bacterium]